MTIQPENVAPPAAPGLFGDPDAARVWNYWFSHRDLGGAPQAVADPFADDYVLAQALWFRGGPEVDAEIARHFEPLMRRAAAGELDAWRESPRECLALIVLLDQFPRNIHRGTAGAFAYDEMAQALARDALARGLDRPLAPAEQLFFHMALTHSEQLADVRASLAGIRELATRCTRGQQRLARSWQVGTQKHIDVLERFGRYPHRNRALGRVDTPAEAAFLQHPEFTALFMRSQLPRAEAVKPAAADAPASGRRLKILALHGFRQNGEVFRARIRKLRDALADVAELVFVTSPTAYSPQGDTREGTLAAFGEVPDYPMQRVWWQASADNSEYQGFDASVAYLETVFRTQGPFDGVVGFAQGGTLAAVLAAMQPHPAIAFEFAICISAFPSRADAHAEYVQPGKIKVPALHVLGRGDILVTPDRSIDLFNTFDPATARLVQHDGGHFVPAAWPYPQICAFVEQFVETGVDADGPARSATPGVALLDLAIEALSAPTRSPGATLDVPLVQSILQEMADQERWRELQAVAVHAHGLRGADDVARPEASPLVAVHEEIVELFARGLQAALLGAARIERRRGVAPERSVRLALLLGPHGIAAELEGEADEAWPTLFARDAPRIGAHADKSCRLARDIATEVFRREDMLDFIATREGERAQQPGSPPLSPPTGARRRARQSGDLETQARHLSYQRYSQALSCVAGVLADMDPARVRDRLRKLRAAPIYSPEIIAARRAAPISRQVREPEPEPVVPCSLADLDPLLGHLKNNLSVDQQTPFNKGTMTTDGRLDLCKQVVGPAGIGPLLGAMKHSDRVKRLLLGNNIVGDGGAAEIAGFLRERKDSPLDCWYIAGNNIGPQGIAEVCDALADDRKVTSLWLKRNPLKAAGMRPIARLLRANSTLEVLDLVNCGLLDDGLEVVLGALMGEHANKTLRHLYLGTNGITERSAPQISEFLAKDCALESFFLSCNRLGDDGVVRIAEGLAANRTIGRVSLASNCIGPRGAAALAEALKNHPSIVLLDLGFTKATVAVGELGNFIGDDGARALAGMLQHNTTLRSLDLLHNYISQVGVNHLREALKVNRTLVHLQLTQFGRVHNEPGKEELRAALQRNRELVPADQAERVGKIGLPDHITEIYSVYRTHS